MIIFDRIQTAVLRQKYRDDVISQISAKRDAGYSIAAIAQSMGLSESTVRNIIKKFL